MRPTILGALLGLALGYSAAVASTVEAWVPIDVVSGVLKDARLLAYFHVNLPERQTITVSSTLLPPDFESLVLGYAVRVVAEDSAEATKAFQFTKLNVTDSGATVDVAYPPEGIIGQFVFVREGNGWVLKQRRLREH